ncbi:MAG: hypothetical protein SLAVMIC_00883 [uncultured marine phage]|uniref:Uncharacterized protein n=1 Tax=uncultured marine phage TaxID=707152 RepID=A0A8D9FQL6_9VIRU|nr:MAG: hypothetical protein SLAVMIC_00883 [uncultured marine phage]
MILDKETINEIYSDSFLISVKEVLNLPKDFKFDENIEFISVTDDVRGKLKALCIYNRVLRDKYNQEERSNILNCKWPVVLETHFGIKI